MFSILYLQIGTLGVKSACSNQIKDPLIIYFACYDTLVQWQHYETMCCDKSIVQAQHSHIASVTQPLAQQQRKEAWMIPGT